MSPDVPNERTIHLARRCAPWTQTESKQRRCRRELGEGLAVPNYISTL